MRASKCTSEAEQKKIVLSKSKINLPTCSYVGGASHSNQQYSFVEFTHDRILLIESLFCLLINQNQCFTMLHLLLMTAIGIYSGHQYVKL